MPLHQLSQMEIMMTKSMTITETLDTLANLIIENYKDHVGDIPNDYFVKDVAMGITKVPYWSAQSKRNYIERLHGLVLSSTQYDVDGKPLSDKDQGKAYHDAQDKYERLAPRLEMEAMSFDALAVEYTKWFEQYTGEEFILDQRKAPANKRSKAEIAAMKAIEARRAKVA